jgi:hypothetical protein
MAIDISISKRYIDKDFYKNPLGGTYVFGGVGGIDAGSTTNNITNTTTNIYGQLNIEVSTNYTVLPNYIVLGDASISAFNVTLPASPINGDIIEVKDINNISSTNNITIKGNSNKIDGLAEDLIIDVNGASVKLIYHSIDTNWAILNMELFEDYGGSVASDETIVSDWILATGYWDDTGYWRDEEVWID